LTTSQPRTLGNAPMPANMAALPRNAQGYPIPWFVATLPDGSRDFRIASGERWHDAVRFNKCWVCGRTYGRFMSFLIGPMCAVNRITAEPPCHHECAVYSARCCPFMAAPQMRRRESGKPEESGPPAGVAIERNPGVGLVWTTRQYRIMRVAQQAGPDGEVAVQAGKLIQLGDPTRLEWYAEGRDATLAEIRESMRTGLPLLEQAADLDDNPAMARVMLAKQWADANALLLRFGPQELEPAP